jgi:hypothetical protein
MISKPILELAMCAKLKLIVNNAIYRPSWPLGARLRAKELEKGNMNISPKVIKSKLTIKIPAQALNNKT